MADLVTNQGLNDLLNQWQGHTNDPIDAIGLSNFGALAAGTTSIGAAGFSQVNAINATSAASGQACTISADFTNAQIGGSNWTTITAHNDGAGADTGVQCGTDDQDVTLNGVDITIEITLTAATA